MFFCFFFFFFFFFFNDTATTEIYTLSLHDALPTFAPALLKSPAKDALGLLHVVASSVPFSADLPKARDVASKYKAKYTEPPNSGVPYGYAVADIWGQVLTQACADKDLTRAGVQAALKKTTHATTEDLIAPLDFSKPGAPPTHQVYVALGRGV